nr:DUF485 domain-containing protein [Mycetocola spongiae]
MSSVPSVDYLRAASSPEFRLLRRRQRRFIFPLAAAFLVWYLAYVICAVSAPAFMAISVWGHLNIGLLWGLAQFVSTFGITAGYVVYANRRLDPLARNLRADLDAEARA